MKVHILNYGCSANQASAEIMAAKINEYGHELVDDESSAQAVVINTCTVKSTTEKKILHRISEIGKTERELVVTGCMPQVQMKDIIEANSQAHVLGVNSITEIGNILNKIQNSNKGSVKDRIELLSSVPEGFLNVDRIRHNPNIHICQISQGCNHRCSYCIVRDARGPLTSFDPKDIVDDVKKAISEGCREVWITSQDNGQYGADIQSSLPELLNMLCKIPEHFKIRVGMMNPFSVLPILDDLIKAFENDKIYKLLHLPIQSASENTLSAMNRNHSMKDVEDIISRFRYRFGDLTLFTDIIVGFPYETDDDFNKSVEWIKEYCPDKINISRYTPRPGTPAFNYRNIDSRIVAKRSKTLHKACEEVKIESKRKMIGWKGEAFISMEAKFEGFMARTQSYKPVVIKDDNISPGDICTIEVIDVMPGYFIGKTVS
ncbi:MiaB-like tRNA modifying enzyme [Methanosalsum zhilinae DSM 4017]|uniref:tRNA-t(6)A37 methylthiotransferase n=1 Tax=Methanosalsum zhilinae (strain DSM 4017 / NBRC 107636 / OCM 62 / WeN5) TaxID=679901 RepID=F7XLH7_METZD|nr:tRNA (N(6)-L-threonylcarbamoyladenosine(37)-C(2))-methylthiotransferase [Methanosalsum zhilinae]AEH60702.1 MiaB-like tRNA modifying enzyme [Methanosalsum zhilinae DSM 4017]